MKKKKVRTNWIKVVASIMALLLVVVSVMIGSIMYFFDPNKLKPVIVSEVKKSTGYDLKLDGQMTWSFFPRLGVQVDQATLTQPKQTQAFLTLRHLTFVTDLQGLLRGSQKLRGDVYIDEVNLMQVVMQHAHAVLNWHDGVLSISPLTATVHGGDMTAAITARHLMALPQWDADVSFHQVHIQALLESLYGTSKLQLVGDADLAMHLTTEGLDRQQLLSGLHGKANWSLAKGAIEGMDVNYLWQTADAIIYKKPLAAPVNTNRTPFDSLVGDAVIKNGIVDVQHFALMSPLFTTTVTGSINLVYEALNLDLQLTPQANAPRHWIIPVMITGGFTRPDVRLDMTELNIMLARAQLEKVKTKVREQIKLHMSGKTGDLLEQIVGQ